TLPLLIGGHAEGQWNFNGRVDEVSLYDRALSQTEIQGIYTGGTGGKCVTPAAPFIVTEPANQTVTVGGTATFSVAAGGSQPLSYQWNIGGTDIPGATSST